MTQVLIIVDVQNDFCEGGALPVPGGIHVAEEISNYIDRSQDDYAIIVATMDTHISPGAHFSETPDYKDSWPPHCVFGTEGWRMAEPVRDAQINEIFLKGTTSAAYSAFEGRSSMHDRLLGDYLPDPKDVGTIDVCGLALDYCVKATALDARDRGYDVRVLLPFTAAVTPETGEEAKRELLAAGVELVDYDGGWV